MGVGLAERTLEGGASPLQRPARLLSGGKIGALSSTEPASRRRTRRTAKDLEKELDPQMAQIDERLSRIEALLENLQRRELPDQEEPEALTSVASSCRLIHRRASSKVGAGDCLAT